jgi:hypothetical protein
MAMKVIVPIPITTDPQLLAHNATETAYAAWVTATSYTATTDFVLYNHRAYKCLVTHTSGPTTLPDAIGGTTWLDLGPSNKWALFDQEVSTATTKVGNLSVTIKPSAGTSRYFDSVCVLAVTGAGSVRVQVFNGTGRTTGPGDTVGGDLVYTSTATLDNTYIGDMYQYYFNPFEIKTEVVFTGIPPYLNGEVVLTITANTGGTTVSCGALICGLAAELGGVQYGASSGITDYSIKETDAYGITTFVRRNAAKRTNYTLWVDNTQIRRVYSVLSEVRATPCVWLGSEEYTYSPLIVFGFYEDFDITVAQDTYSVCSLQVQGMI